MAFIEENELLYRKWVNEVWNKGNEDVIDELLDKNGIVYFPHFVPGDEKIHGREEFKEFVRIARSRYQNIKASVDDLVVKGEKVIALCKLEGIYTDETGFEVPIKSKALCSIVFKEGKIVELWNNVELDAASRGAETTDFRSAKC